MARISLWNPIKGNDYHFADRVSSENMFMGGTGCLIHKYNGIPGEEGDVTAIQDVLFLENRDRVYDSSVYELRGHYTPEDVDYDLSQFGIFLSDDQKRFTFHYNDMIQMLGRKLMSGDVIELPCERDTTLDGIALNAYYVVQDALYSAPGRGMTWYPHIWKVRAKQMPASPEYQDVLDKAAQNDTAGGEGDGTGIMPLDFSETVDACGNPGFGCNAPVRDALNRYCTLLGITDEIVAEAEANVRFDPKFFEIEHLWIRVDESGYPQLQYFFSGDGIPPNDDFDRFRGMGVIFPDDMVDGEYFLRVDYSPDRLFQKQGNCFKRIEDDLRRVWTVTNRRLDSYLNNIKVNTFEDGTSAREKQALSKVLSARYDMSADYLEEIKKTEELRQQWARRLDGADEG